MLKTVNKIVAVGLICLSPWLYAKESITADGLRRYAMNKAHDLEKRGVSPSDLRAMLGVINGKDAAIYYHYRGKTFPGIQLPDGTIAPALVDQWENKSPGCLANNGQIYPASWSVDHLICQLPYHQSAVVPMEGSVEVRWDNETVTGSVDDVWTRKNEEGKAGQVWVKQTVVGEVGEDAPDTQRQLYKYNSTGESTDNNFAPLIANTPIEAGAVKGLGSPVTARRSASVDPDIYVPPPRSNVSDLSVSMNLSPEHRKFGIPFGTWVEAELMRPATNADSGEVEVILRETVWGKNRPLPSGTILYGNKSFNTGTHRLDIVIRRGITLRDEEISLLATVYNERKEFSGLSGVIVRDRQSEGKSIAANAALRTAGAALQQATPEGLIVGTAYDSVTDQVLDNELDNLKEQQGPIIKVFPQSLFLRFDQSL